MCRCPALPGASRWLWASYPGNKSTINCPALALGTRAAKLCLEPSVRAGPGRDPLKPRLRAGHPLPGALGFSPANPTLLGALSCPERGRSLQNSALQVQKGPLRAGGRGGGRRGGGSSSSLPLPQLEEVSSVREPERQQSGCAEPIWHPVGLPRAQRPVPVPLGALLGLPLPLPTASFFCLYL